MYLRYLLLGFLNFNPDDYICLMSGRRWYYIRVDVAVEDYSDHVSMYLM